MELLRRFRGGPDAAADGRPRRTVADLLDAAAEVRHERERQAEAARAAQEARREQQRAAARENRLDAIARDPEITWTRIDELIDTRKPSDYDTAVELLKDLQAIADRAGARRSSPTGSRSYTESTTANPASSPASPTPPYPYRDPWREPWREPRLSTGGTNRGCSRLPRASPRPLAGRCPSTAGGAGTAHASGRDRTSG